MGARRAGGTARSSRGGLIDARDDGRHTGLTPAQWYCLLAGAALLLAGLTGFLADASFDTGGTANGALQGDSLLGFEVNGWHNLVHLASGLVLLAAFRSRGAAKAVALAFGAVYGVVTLIGLIDGNDIFGLFPVNGADNVLHLALAAVGIFAALVSPTNEHRGRRTERHRTATPSRDERFARDEDRAPASRDVDALSGRPRDDRTITRND